MTAKRIVALLPMRHHSQRVPEKNYRPLAGKPLYQHIVDTLLMVPELNQIVIDTDSPVIMAGLREKYPQVLILERPEHLRADWIPMNEVLMNATAQVPADLYLQTHSTNIPKETSGRIASNLRESKFLRVYSVRDRDGDDRPSVTNYQLVQASGNYALLDISLETGRKNHIRVHLADIGHPVAGDKKYGARTNPVGRLALHAYFLAFAHPVTGERLELRSLLPGKFKALFPDPTGLETGTVPKG